MNRITISTIEQQNVVGENGEIENERMEECETLYVSSYHRCV